MALKAPSASGLTALLIALGVGLLLAWSQRTTGPSRAELAEALRLHGAKIVAADIRSLQCEQSETDFACSWLQRDKDGWVDRSGLMQAGSGGWRIADAASGGRQ